MKKEQKEQTDDLDRRVMQRRYDAEMRALNESREMRKDAEYRIGLLSEEHVNVQGMSDEQWKARNLWLAVAYLDALRERIDVLDEAHIREDRDGFIKWGRHRATAAIGGLWHVVAFEEADRGPGHKARVAEAKQMIERYEEFLSYVNAVDAGEALAPWEVAAA